MTPPQSGIALGETTVIVEDKLTALGFTLPDLDEQYHRNASGARFISHYAVQNVLYLSGTTPMKDGQPFNPGVLGKDLTLQQGYDAARYATLASLAAVKYALGDLDRVQQVVQVIGFVNSAAGFQRSTSCHQRRHRPPCRIVRRARQADARSHWLPGVGHQPFGGNRHDGAVCRQRRPAPLARDHYAK